MRTLRSLAGLVLLLSLPACTTLFFQPLDRAHWATPKQYGLPYEDVWFDADDGVPLHGWFLPAFGEAGGTVTFLHGNTEDIGTHIAEIAWMPAAGLNVFLFDYRGYGLSGGTPGLPGVLNDIESALRVVTARRDLGRGIIVYGQSIGGALAPYVLARSAQRHRVKALITDGAFASFGMIARDALGDYLFRHAAWGSGPLRRIDAYSPVDAIARLAPIPVLIIHSDADKVVAPGHARLLYAAARAPKTLWLLPQGAHARTLRDPATADIRSRWLRYALTALSR